MRDSPSQRRTALGILAALCALLGAVWLLFARPAGSPQMEVSRPIRVDSLTPGTVASMDSSVFAYSPGWTVSADGADPVEPADPWQTPAGVISFTYRGRELALLLNEGDYWGYFYITVDGEPANGLPSIPGNTDSTAAPAAYKPLYAPERAAAAAPVWLPVHRSRDPGPHAVRIEVWRSWGQRPLRAAAVDSLPPPARPAWPGVLLLAAAAAAGWTAARPRPRRPLPLPPLLRRLGQAIRDLRPVAATPAAIGLVAIALGTAWPAWWLCLMGAGLLALASIARPALWTAALLFGLPFYYAFPLPLLPNRSFSLVDLGVLAGVPLLAVHWLLAAPPARPPLAWLSPAGRWTLRLLAVLAGWALVSAAGAAGSEVALREWRTVFLTAGIFGFTLAITVGLSADADADRRLLVRAWLGGATIVAAAGIWHYYTRSTLLIDAEGVQRIRGFYGSPNNLALYLDRTLAVALALGLFLRSMPLRIVWGAAAALQLLALLLTFSKGSLLLALPALLLVLWLGGMRLLRRQGRSQRRLWGLALAALAAALVLAPFLGTERLRALVNLGEGTGFLRLQLWRSAWQMALDHPALGVGPDNFLSAYRSGYLLPTAWQEPNLNHPHNWLLDWWTRLGLPGLLLGIGFWAAGVIGLWNAFERASRRTGSEDGALALGFLAAAAAALAHGLIDASYALPDLMLVWVFLFLVGDSLRINRQR